MCCARPPSPGCREVLHAAQEAGRPYHVVHFDGHGTWLDLGRPRHPSRPRPAMAAAGLAVAPVCRRCMYGVSVAGPVRPGQHGYLLFEDPGSEENQQLVDGPTLGRLLTGTGVPVLVLNACRSAYAEARDQPADAPGTRRPHGHRLGRPALEDSALTGDVHARIRAYGSLAAEVADAGVPGVVAMRYNVYVVTAAQFMADLYAHLLAGKSLGQAAAAARRALAADPVRQIGAVPVALQDWAVPVVYESAPLVLLRPPDRAAPLIKLTPAETRPDRDGVRAAGVPRPPDAGFFGRDETLLALDRAFDTQPVVLLHAFAGAGKSSTAAEFARWYQATGGLDLPGHPEWPGAVLWSSFEHHLTADRVIGTAGDYFAGAAGGQRHRLGGGHRPGPAPRHGPAGAGAGAGAVGVGQRRAGHRVPRRHPKRLDPGRARRPRRTCCGTWPSSTRCKVLLTSRRDEHPWLGDLPARVQLPPMPMRESLQLAAALAARHGQSLGGADWRPLLRYAAGNPLTITVLVGQALRDNLTTTEADRGVRGPAAGRGSRSWRRGRTRRWAAPGRWPPR